MLSRHPQVFLIFAIDNNMVMGKDNDIPWRSLQDFKWFRQNTITNNILMGRKTWESLPLKPLPDRGNFVITRDLDYREPEAFVENSLEAAIERSLKEYPNRKVFIIGGKAVLEEAAKYAAEAYISYVDVNTTVNENCVMAPTLPKHETISIVDLFEGDYYHPAVKVKTIRFID